jgi:hypothetical protein
MNLHLDKRVIHEFFGHEEALGVRYIDQAGKLYTPTQVTEYYVRHGKPMDDVESQFPDGTDAVRCTHYAMQVYRRFPSHTQIFGFTNAANPDCEFARKQWHPGGHDFAIIDGRWLVDPWARHVACAYDEIVYDLESPDDAALAQARYGKRDNWRHMTGAEEHAREISQGAL